MAKAYLQVEENGSSRLLFNCPGCGCLHGPFVERGVPLWQWNGDLEKPTVSPSVLVNYQSRKHDKPQVCHFFLRNGKLEFLGDCTHELRGQVVDLPDWD